MQTISVLPPELRNRVFVRRLLNRNLPFRLVRSQLGQPICHMLQPRLSQASEVHQEAPGLAFEAMLEFVIIEPVSWHPGDFRGGAYGLVPRFCGIDHVSHCSLLAKPAEILFRVREWVGDDLGQEVEG